MAHTRSRRRSRRRILRREAPSIVPVLAEERHFARMRAYGSFAFDDHPSYLRQLEGMLRALTEQQVHTRLALFDPADYERFCRDQRLDPDTPASRSRYVAEVAVAGTSVPYGGEALAGLLPRLRDAHEARLTWQAGADLLAREGTCARCGADLAKAAFERAANALGTLLERSGPGVHHLVVSVAAPGSPLAAALDVRRTAEGICHAHEPAVLALTTVLAAGFATRSHGGLVCRTQPGGPAERDGDAGGAREGDVSGDVVRGWRLELEGAWLSPLSAAEVFAAYCTEPATGEPVPPEPGVEYAPGHELPRPGGPLHC